MVPLMLDKTRARGHKLLCRIHVPLAIPYGPAR